MKLPFTLAQFLGVFEKYNLAIWPMQVIVYFLGIAGLILAIKKNRYSDRVIAAILSFFWLWMGIVYHLMFFSDINKVARVFGMLFIAQGVLFLAAGVITTRISFRFKSNVYSFVGIIFILYAMIVYPIIGYLLGHGYPRSPGFGIAPCPTTIFTLGLLLWTDKRVPKYLLFIPLIWSLIGFYAAIALSIKEDIGLLIAGLAGTLLVLIRDKKIAKENP